MGCVYPITSRNYMTCNSCRNRIGCTDAVLSIEFQSQPTPPVKPPKGAIPSASEMNKVTNVAIDKNNAEELSKIANLIRKTAEDGKFGIREVGSLSPYILNELRKMGYDADNIFSSTNEQLYIINWYDIE